MVRLVVMERGSEGKAPMSEKTLPLEAIQKVVGPIGRILPGCVGIETSRGEQGLLLRLRMLKDSVRPGLGSSQANSEPTLWPLQPTGLGMTVVVEWVESENPADKDPC